MKDIQQLIKKNNVGSSYSDIYPLTFTSAVKDRETDKPLSEILSIYNFYFLPYLGSDQETRLTVPKKYRRRGLWVSWVRFDNTFVVEYYIADDIEDEEWSSDNNWAPCNKAYLGLDQLNPEDLTLTNEDPGRLQFANREYDPSVFSGKGYVILRKNIQEGKNILTQEMIQDQNTVYHIRYDYDLNGETITLGEGSVLCFQGGSFSNGTIVGTNTDIRANSSYKIFKNIVIKGTWQVPDIYSNWFDFNISEGANNQVNLQNLCNLTSDNFYGTIYIAPMTIWASTDSPNGKVMTVASNTHIILDAAINLNTNNYTHYDIIYAEDKDNVHIEGSGTITGDLRTHTGTTGEFGYCIHFLGVRNGSVKNLSLTEAWGDSISVDSSTARRSENIQISGLYCANSRRQGLSIEGAKDIYVKDCVFEGIYRGISGTFPGAAIDVEPWREGDIAENIYVENCTASDCYKGFVASGTNKNVVFSKCSAYNSACQAHNFSEEVVSFVDCNFNGVLFCHSCNIEVSNSHINQVLFGTDPKQCSFKNCHIGGTNLQDAKVGSSSRGLVCKTGDSSFGNDAVFNFVQCTFEPILRTVDNVIFNLTWSNIPENVKVNLYNCEILPIGTNIQNNYANLYNCFVRTNRFSLNRACPYTIELVGNTFMQDSGDSFFQIDFDNGNDPLLFKAYNNSFIVAYPWFYFAYDVSDKRIEFVNNTFSVEALRSYQYAITAFYKKFSASSVIQFNRILPAITKGTTEERPLIGADDGGFTYYDTTLKKNILWDGTTWVDGMGFPAGLTRGTTEQRPVLGSTDYGYIYYDAELGKCIVWNGIKWINTDGSTLALTRGTTAQRPVLESRDYGFQYYDTDIEGLVIWTGTVWKQCCGGGTPTDPYVLLSKENLLFPYEGGAENVDISSNSEWEVTIS